MRILSCLLIALGVYLLASAGHDEFRGSTTKPMALMERGHNTRYLYSIHVLRKNNPELFHEFMVTHWIYASVVTAAGCVLCVSYRKKTDL